MKLAFTKSLTVSLAIAAAIALPTAVKAEVDSLSESTVAIATLKEEISTETNWCYYIPGLGLIGPSCL